METVVNALTNGQVWTVTLSALAGLAGALAPIMIAKIDAGKAAAAAKCEVEKAAQNASVVLKANVRKDAVEEWTNLYSEREKQVVALQAQNADQQKQLDLLKYQHRDCEDRYAMLERKVECLSGAVTKIAGGGK